MANKEAEAVESGASGSETKTSFPLIPMVLAVVGAMVFVLVVVAGAGFWLMKSGKLGPGAAQEKTAPAVVEATADRLSLVSLEPLLVNLADEDKRSYLRVAVTLQVEDKPDPKEAKGGEEKAAKGKPVNRYEAEERDTLLDVLGRQTGVDLLSPDGKDHVKLQMLQALRSRIKAVTFKDIYFAEFLVQR